MSIPRVTIGLPVYNGEQYLAAAIGSILAQDFDDFELLVSDNGSTDRSVEIAQVAADRDRRVVVYKSGVNRGASWNYNRLVDLARGEYFKWAAHDDVLESQFLRRCVEVLDTRADVVLCYAQTVDIDETDRVVYRHDRTGYATCGGPSRRARDVLLGPGFPYFASFGLMRRSDLMRTNRIGAYADSDNTLFLELALMGRFHEVPEVLFLHREHSGRSIRRYPDSRARNIWFDPLRAGKVTAPRWRLLTELALAIARSRTPVSERMRAFKPLCQWANTYRGILMHEVAAIPAGRARAILKVKQVHESDEGRST